MSSSASQDAVAGLELDTIASSSAHRPGRSTWEDREPLLPRSPPSGSHSHLLPTKDCEDTLSGIAFRRVFSSLPLPLQQRSTSTMSRFRGSKASRLLDKLQTESEPGLTNAQLMLTNYDLKPVEPERRQWGPWNFVGRHSSIQTLALQAAGETDFPRSKVSGWLIPSISTHG
jgi:hypothetical protein